MLLRRLIGLLVGVAVLAGVGFMFWSAMHPTTAPEGDRQPGFAGPPSPYSTEGGHSPLRHQETTRDEIRFRGFDLDKKQ